MVNYFSYVVDFCIVYIEEVYLLDGWVLRVSNVLCIVLKLG